MIGESLVTMKKLFIIAKKQKAIISFNPSQTIIEKEKKVMQLMKEIENRIQVPVNNEA